MNSSCDDSLNLHVLITELEYNREVEIMLCEVLYFIEPQITQAGSVCYAVWNVDIHNCIFIGTMDELLEFRFPEGYTLAGNFSAFRILYIY